MQYNKLVGLLSILLLFSLLTGCGTSQPSKQGVNITISAAASMKDAMTELKSVYEKKSNNTVSINFGASGTLQHQIEQGAPVDLFLSASRDKMDILLNKGLIDKNHVKNLLKNDIVLIVPKNENSPVHTLNDLTNSKVKKVSIGIPESVPAGKYAKESLLHTSTWDTLQNKIVLAKDVRQVLDYVETGNVDAGIVYHTDALISSKVKIVSTIDESTHSPIIYPVGIVKDTKHIKQAIDFYHFLQTKEAQTIFEKYGFKIAGK